jgi:hypothetical protein
MRQRVVGWNRHGAEILRAACGRSASSGRSESWYSRRSGSGRIAPRMVGTTGTTGRCVRTAAWPTPPSSSDCSRMSQAGSRWCLLWPGFLLLVTPHGYRATHGDRPGGRASEGTAHDEHHSARGTCLAAWGMGITPPGTTRRQQLSTGPRTIYARQRQQSRVR